ncbi:MAG TPA: hypothetical protein VFA52_02595 [Candidatus Paceibacterota bacterium]|nr:hypothetical protein [Candidatus Paceibacterota bacterium]
MKSERPNILIRLWRLLYHDYIYKPREKRWIKMVLEKTQDKEIKTYE